MQFDIGSHVYREVYGEAIFMHFLLNFLTVGWIIITSLYKYPSLSYLNKLRFGRIVFSWFVLILLLLFLQLVLPVLGIWVLEKEIVFIFMFFVIEIVYILRRYYFSSIGYWVTRGLIIGVSFGISLIIVQWMNVIISLATNSTTISSYWAERPIQSPSFFVKFLIGLIFYELIYISLSKRFLGITEQVELHENIQLLQRLISETTNMSTLELLLWDKLRQIFRISTCELSFYSDHPSPWLEQFFHSHPHQVFFINDFVFIEENTKYIDTQKVKKELSKDDFLILPIHNILDINIWVLKLWVRSLGDFYTKIEIEELLSFSFFLEIHLKYMGTYNIMQDLSMNLDKKVDDKTIEYNNLINRQKEFISIISHEIRSPIWTAIFQSDSIIDDLNAENIEPVKLKEELSILNKQLVRTGWLLTKLFSVEYYDTHSVNLFRERVDIVRFLESEIEIFSHIHTAISFTSNIDKNIGSVEIDKIQFQQVISNLLDNAVKFLNGKNPTITVSALKKWGFLVIIIEDNGLWFQWIQVQDIFEKYTTWSNWTIWLWMGLYLCKKIISMHNGTIEASSSKEGVGARFTITIPLR